MKVDEGKMNTWREQVREGNVSRDPQSNKLGERKKKKVKVETIHASSIFATDNSVRL